MSNDFDQTAQTIQTSAFIQKYAAAQQNTTKEAAWEIVYKAMSLPEFKDYLPEGFVPTETPAPVKLLTLPEMYLFVEAAHRLGDAQVVAYVDRLRGAVPATLVPAAVLAAQVVSQAPRSVRAYRTRQPKAGAPDVTKAPRATMAARPASYMLAGNGSKHHEVQSWGGLLVSLLGRVLSKGSKAVSQVPEAWFRAEASKYTTEIPGGTGAYQYAFTTLKVADLMSRCSRLLKILHVDNMSVELKDQTLVEVQAA